MKLFLLGQGANGVIDDYGRAGPAGEEFHYASINTQALAMLVSAVYRQPLIRVMESRLWHPLGARAASWNIDDTDGRGTPIAFCCINARLRDFAKLGQLYLQGGRWRGRRLLPAGWVREATTPRAPFLKPDAMAKNGDGQDGYGYQWWIPPGPQRTYMALGLMGQYIYVSEPDDVVIVRTAAAAGSDEEEREMLTVFKTIANDFHKPASAPEGGRNTADPVGPRGEGFQAAAIAGSRCDGSRQFQDQSCLSASF